MYEDVARLVDSETRLDDLDVEELKEDLAYFEMTEAQEEELIGVLINIMETFVNIGWQVDTVHMVLPELFEKDGSDSGNSVDSEVTEVPNAKTACEAGKGNSNE